MLHTAAHLYLPSSLEPRLLVSLLWRWPWWGQTWDQSDNDMYRWKKEAKYSTVLCLSERTGSVFISVSATRHKKASKTLLIFIFDYIFTHTVPSGMFSFCFGNLFFSWFLYFICFLMYFLRKRIASWKKKIKIKRKIFLLCDTATFPVLGLTDRSFNQSNECKRFGNPWSGHSASSLLIVRRETVEELCGLCVDICGGLRGIIHYLKFLTRAFIFQFNTKVSLVMCFKCTNVIGFFSPANRTCPDVNASRGSLLAANVAC